MRYRIRWALVHALLGLRAACWWLCYVAGAIVAPHKRVLELEAANARVWRMYHASEAFKVRKMDARVEYGDLIVSLEMEPTLTYSVITSSVDRIMRDAGNPPNYLEAGFEMTLADGVKKYVVTVQRDSGKSPGRLKAEVVDAARAALRILGDGETITPDAVAAVRDLLGKVVATAVDPVPDDFCREARARRPAR